MGVAALQGEAAFEAVCRLVSQATPFVWLARLACILPEGGAALQVLHGHQQFDVRISKHS